MTFIRRNYNHQRTFTWRNYNHIGSFRQRIYNHLGTFTQRSYDHLGTFTQRNYDHLGTFTQRNYDHLRTFTQRNYDHLVTFTQRNYDHLKTFRWRNYNHFIIVIQLQIMYNPKRTFIAKLLYVVKALRQHNLDSRVTIITLRPLHHATTNYIIFCVFKDLLWCSYFHPMFLIFLS